MVGGKPAAFSTVLFCGEMKKNSKERAKKTPTGNNNIGTDQPDTDWEFLRVLQSLRRGLPPPVENPRGQQVKARTPVVGETLRKQERKPQIKTQLLEFDDETHNTMVLVVR